MKVKKIVIALIIVFLTGMIASVALAQKETSTVSNMTMQCPVRIEPASVLPPEELALEVGLAFEFDREWQDLKYDNFRLAPLCLRYGLMPYLEIGGILGFSANDGNDDFAPDDSGFEGLSIFGKLELNDFASLQVGLTFFGDDDVYPYPSDGTDLFINLPLQRPLGKGLLYGEFGYTVQGGDLDDSNHFSYGIGYAYPVAEEMSFNVELGGDEAHNGTANTLDLLLGVNFMATERLRLAPFITIGINNAGPKFALGSSLEFRF